MTELLSSTIKDLTAEINRLNQRAIQIEGLINTLDFQIRECNNNSDTKSIKQKISQLNATIISLDVDGWWHDIYTYYQEHKWYSKHPIRLNFWKREEACKHFYTYIIDRINDYIKLQFDELISANSVETVIIDHQSRMRKKVFHVGECSWESKPEQLRECMKELATIICDSIQANVDKAIFDLEEVLKGNMQQKQVWANFKKLQEKDLEEIRANIILCDAKIRHYNNELSTLEIRKHDDIITLEHYLDIAKQAYHNYRNRMISLINRNDTTPEEKIKLLLYIGILDKDYQKIAGGTE